MIFLFGGFHDTIRHPRGDFVLMAIKTDSFGGHIVQFTLNKDVVELIIVYIRVSENVLFEDCI